MSPDTPRLPHFFIAGAPKCGTTSLYHHLDQHPGIYMSPIKEPNYWAPEFHAEPVARHAALFRAHAEKVRTWLDGPMDTRLFAGPVTSLADYHRLFRRSTDHQVLGEASPNYLWSPQAPARIAAAIPTAKIIAILRNPADRAFSQYRQMANSGGVTHNFQQHLEKAVANTDRRHLSDLWPFLELGLYATQIERYRTHFPTSQIRVWLYEDTLAPNFHYDVFDFLNVDTCFTPDTSTRYLEQPRPRFKRSARLIQDSGLASLVRRTMPSSARPLLKKLAFRRDAKPVMRPFSRAWLIDYYRDDIRRLEQLLQRDLSAWLR